MHDDVMFNASLGFVYDLLLGNCGYKTDSKIYDRGGGGRDEVWDRETMFSQLAKRSLSVVVSR